MSFKVYRWNEYEIRLFHFSDSLRGILPFIPYYWDSEIALDLAVRPIKRTTKMNDDWTYKWELCDLDGTVIKYGNDVLNIVDKRVRRYLTHWSFGKRRVFVINSLPPNKYYELYMSISDKDGVTSDRLRMATFTIKDREEYYMQFFLGIILIFIAVVLSRC
ncbi:hypothetical protein ACFLVB_03840 [Chloroflexota bacterium]